MRLSITSVDHAPAELDAQTPFTATILRQLPGRDRPDYFLAALDRPLKWKTDAGETAITHLVLCARWVGGALSPSMRDTPVNIAYVTDASLLEDAKLDFKKCFYAAIGTADGIG